MPDNDEAVQTASEYIEDAIQSQEVNVEYLESFAGDVTKHHYYDAYLCKITRLNPPAVSYNIFVRENHPESKKKIVYEKYFLEIPAFTLSRNTLALVDEDRNRITFCTFKLIYKANECYTEETQERILNFPNYKLVKDASCSAECRNLLAQNL